MCIPYMWWTYRHMIDGMRMRRSPNEERERAKNRSAPASTFGWASARVVAPSPSRVARGAEQGAKSEASCYRLFLLAPCAAARRCAALSFFPPSSAAR